MIYQFENYSFDVDRQELRRGPELVTIEPQVLDLLHYLIRNRERVVSKDDLIANVWNGRIVSESTLTSRITSARQAIGDSGEQQRLIRTIPRKGLRFVGEVREGQELPNRNDTNASQTPSTPELAAPASTQHEGSGRRQLTAVVCKLTDSTALSASLDPEDMLETMSNYHACVRESVAPHGGFVSKYIGDEVLVFLDTRRPTNTMPNERCEQV